MPHLRPLYGHSQLNRMLNPKSIAIIGASARPGAFGSRLLQNLAEYEGRIHLVNARYREIDGRPCFPSLAALPESPDLAVIVVGREIVESLIAECMAARVGGIMIFASGYSETGRPDRIEQQRRLTNLAQSSGIPIIGPNCIGVVNYGLKSRATFSLPAALPAPDGAAIGIVSQSGALGFGLEQSIYRGVSVSHMLNSGNSCDVDMADFVNFLVDEPACKAIALLFEGMADPLRLISACRRAFDAGKPVVVYKIATGSSGAQAAMSHTGALAGSHAAYKAAFEGVGAVLVGKLEELVETARFLAKAPAPVATGVAVMASSGGAAIMSADFAEIHAVSMPQPGAATQALLETVIPDFGSARNPVDLTAQVLNDEAIIPRVTEALLGDPAYGVLLIPTILSYPGFTSRVSIWGDLSRRLGKPIVNVWTNEWLQGPMSMELEQEPSIALFRSMDRAFAAISAWHRWHEMRAQRNAQSARVAPPEAVELGRILLSDAGTLLTERECKALLSAYGIPVIAEKLVTTADEAVNAACAFGDAVALKVESVDLPHKTEAGVIRLGLRTPEDVRKAYAAVMENAAKVKPAPRIKGVLVQPMAPAGIEIVIGGRTDPLFGAMVVVGLGGVLVELLQDVVVAPAPVNLSQAMGMLGKLRGRRLLDGFRGTPGVDLEALAAIVCRVSELMADQAATIHELDVNPLIASGTHIVAVDALAVLRDGGGPAMPPHPEMHSSCVP